MVVGSGKQERADRPFRIQPPQLVGQALARHIDDNGPDDIELAQVAAIAGLPEDQVEPARVGFPQRACRSSGGGATVRR